MLFYVNISNLKFAYNEKNARNRRKKRLKKNGTRRRKSERGGKKANVFQHRMKQYILVKRKGNKQKLNFKRYKIKLNYLKTLKCFKILGKLFNFFRISDKLELVTYSLYRKITYSCFIASKTNLWMNNTIKLIGIPVKSIRKQTIDKLLLMGNVEINPGPNQDTNPTQKYSLTNSKMDIMTYNCNGMGNFVKRKRILRKASEIVKKGGIVMLQETHLTSNDQVTSTYNEKFEISSYRSNSAGVLTMFGNEYEVVHSSKDEAGRKLFTVVQKSNEKYLLTNIYCPNDHRTSIDFIEDFLS